MAATVDRSEATMTSSWFYALNNQVEGPVPAFDLLELIANRRISMDSLVWRDGMEEWCPATEVGELGSLIPPPLPDGRELDSANSGQSTLGSPPVVSQPRSASDPTHTVASGRTGTHPWQRWLARVVDVYVVFAFVLGVVMLFAGISVPNNGLLFGLALLVCWIPVEALLLSNWGTTPGKALMNIRVVRTDGRYLTTGEALGRAINVWISGLAFGIPIANLFTLLGSYNRLKKTGATSWDEDWYRVVHGEIGVWRALGVMGVIILMILALASA